MIRATAVYLFVALYVLLMGPPFMLWTLVSGDPRMIYRAAFLCIRIAGWLSGVRLAISGKEKLGDGTYLFLSNHQGNFDGPILVYASARDLRAVVKKEIMKIPVLSLVLKQVGFVPVDRGDPMQARAGLDEGARRLTEGYSFFAFPEGTRSRDGRLGGFKKGVFHMALKAEVPVVPVTINNSMMIQPPGSYCIRPGKVEVTFHTPIPTCGLGIENRDRLIEATREAISSELTSEETETPEIEYHLGR